MRRSLMAMLNVMADVPSLATTVPTDQLDVVASSRSLQAMRPLQAPVMRKLWMAMHSVMDAARCLGITVPMDQQVVGV